MYELPRSLIAAYPSKARAAARLMVIQRRTGEFCHVEFSGLGDFLDPGDLLVLNDTRVFPARLKGKKESGGKVEILLIEPFSQWQSFWLVLLDAAKSPQVGNRIFLADRIYAEVIGDLGKGRYGVRFHHPGEFSEVLAKLGEPPLPPYIHRQRCLSPLDWGRYQTVYASSPGAIAAPTAGFHFTPQLLETLEMKGVERAFLTLHVGPGTFQPVREEQVENHRMEGERYELRTDTTAKINRTRKSGKRVIAIGSTTTRVLEWVARQRGRVEPDEGISRLFIRPGYPFRVIDGLITNFHLPGSTPLILAAAFAGLDLIRRAYEEAIRLQYRFYSYGDAMLIL